MISAKSLTKKIGSKAILKGIDLEVKEGEFLTVFGPNGAGKSTLLKILALLMRPSNGKLTINGLDSEKESIKIRKDIGVISHQTFLYDNLTAQENLEFYGRMYGVTDLKDKLYDALQEVGLEFSLKDPVRTFSRGMLQRLAIARATLHNPKLLFLDEPYTGLDPHAIDILNKVLAKLNTNNRTIFMITHNFEQGLDLSNRIMIMSKGSIVFTGKTKEVGLGNLKDIYLAKIGG